MIVNEPKDERPHVRHLTIKSEEEIPENVKALYKVLYKESPDLRGLHLYFFNKKSLSIALENQSPFSQAATFQRDEAVVLAHLILAHFEEEN